MKRCWIPWVAAITLFCFPAFAGNNEILQAGSLALREHKQEQAVKYFSQIIEAKDPTQAQRVAAYSGRCAAYYKQSLVGKDVPLANQAIEDCRHAIAIQSDYQRAYRLRGTAYLTIGSLERSLSDMNVAVALDPKDYLSWQNRGLVKTNLKQFRDAASDFNQAITLNPNHPWSYYSRGQLHATQNHHSQALADFTTFIRLRPNYGPAYLHRGKSWMLTERYQKALADFRLTLRLKPNNGAAHTYQGITQFLLGDFSSAEKELRKAIQMTPHNMENRIWLFLDLEWQNKPGSEAFAGINEQLKPDQWPGVVSALLLNKISADEALDVVQKTTDPELHREQESLILFLLGEQALLRNLPNMAKQWLQKIRIDRKRMPTILHAAHHELRKLQQQAEETLQGQNTPNQAPNRATHTSSTAPAATLTTTKSLHTLPQAAFDTKAPKAQHAAKKTAGATPASLNTSKPAALNRSTQTTAQPSKATTVKAALIPAIPNKPPNLPKPASTKPPVSHQKSGEGGQDKAGRSEYGEDANYGLTHEVISEIDHMVSRKVTRRSHIKGRYSFLMGSFRNTVYADRALAVASRMGFSVYIQEVAVNKRNHIRVWVGPFKNKKDANAARRRIQAVPGNKPDPVVKF